MKINCPKQHRPALWTWTLRIVHFIRGRLVFNSFRDAWLIKKKNVLKTLHLCIGKKWARKEIELNYRNVNYEKYDRNFSVWQPHILRCNSFIKEIQLEIDFIEEMRTTWGNNEAPYTLFHYFLNCKIRFKMLTPYLWQPFVSKISDIRQEWLCKFFFAE